MKRVQRNAIMKCMRMMHKRKNDVYFSKIVVFIWNFSYGHVFSHFVIFICFTIMERREQRREQLIEQHKKQRREQRKKRGKYDLSEKLFRLSAFRFINAKTAEDAQSIIGE